MNVKTTPYWIKERCNPQLGTYYVACGQLSRAEAKKKESALYGDNVMHRFATESQYLSKLSELKKKRERVHE